MTTVTKPQQLSETTDQSSEFLRFIVYPLPLAGENMPRLMNTGAMPMNQPVALLTIFPTPCNSSLGLTVLIRHLDSRLVTAS